MTADGVYETWRQVAGYEGTYEVSSEGRIRRTGRGPGARVGRIIGQNPNPHRRGYYHCTLSKLECGRRRARTHPVHRVVAYAFLGLRPLGHEINHRNGIKSDNRA